MHTKGPWKTDGCVIFNKPGNVVAFAVDQANARELGVVTQVWELRTENAALIAAAPELLAACKAAVAHGCTLREMHEAIAKAEGRQ
jgi:hypothetical protein